VIKSRFEYHAPLSLDDAAALLPSLEGEVSIISGGTWVVPEMTHGIRSPRHVIDLRRAGLGGIRRDNGSVVVGTTATYADVRQADAAPLELQTMAHGITGGAQVHNQGTIGGSACYANPASDAPGALVGLDATFRLARGERRRELPAAEFFTGSFATVLENGELLTEIVIPAASAGVRGGYYKFKHCESSWPIATAFCRIDAEGAVTRLVLGGVSTVPVIVGNAVGAADGEAVEAAVRATAFEPWGDVLADGGYRTRIAPVVAKRAFLAAADDKEADEA
jgi:CO/xanthine dehydrogenase FAD-binding subunit